MVMNSWGFPGHTVDISTFHYVDDTIECSHKESSGGGEAGFVD